MLTKEQIIAHALAVVTLKLPATYEDFMGAWRIIEENDLVRTLPVTLYEGLTGKDKKFLPSSNAT